MIVERCDGLWTNPGETVLSPFAGIGSEGWASLGIGRKFYGVELKESYFRQAVKNLSSREMQQSGSLFDTEAMVP